MELLDILKKFSSKLRLLGVSETGVLISHAVTWTGSDSDTMCHCIFEKMNSSK